MYKIGMYSFTNTIYLKNQVCGFAIYNHCKYHRDEAVKTTSLAPRFCERNTSGALTAGAALTEVGAATGAWYVVWWRMACHVGSVQNPYDIPLY